MEVIIIFSYNKLIQKMDISQYFWLMLQRHWHNTPWPKQPADQPADQTADQTASRVFLTDYKASFKF